MQEESSTILNTPIERLPVKPDFKTMASTNGFDTIQQIISFPVSTLLTREKFTMHVYSELIDILKRNRLLDLLKQF